MTTADHPADPTAAPDPEPSAPASNPVEQVEQVEESPAGAMEHIAGPVEALRARLEALRASRGIPDTDPADTAAEEAIDRAAAYERYWRNSLAEADVLDMAEHRLTDLAPDQHDRLLAKFAATFTHPTPQVRTMVFAGGVGSGKTSAAIALGWCALEAGLVARLVDHSMLMRWLRPDNEPKSGPYANRSRSQLRDLFEDADFLVLDDLGAALDSDRPVSQHVKDETLQLINARVNMPGRFTVITTNHPSEVRDDAGNLMGGLSLMFGDQLLSRISKRGHALAFRGHDRRTRLSW